jgi:hypothetical protein
MGRYATVRVDFVAVFMRVLRVFNAGRGLTGFGVEVS